VLIRGETGTGKERVAKALHEGGSRAGKAFMRVHCAALPEALLEAELFGYEKGAFTGAVARKPGRVELAHGGTLFLDEIGDISPHVQVKLLRVLQEREFERVGGTETLKVDVRFVAATHRDLEAMVAVGTFREDLFYRLNVVSLLVPPLRERRDDVETLAQHFAKQFGERNGKPKARFESGAIERLRAYPWPGNVRQLQNLVERMVVLGDEDQLRDVDVVRELGQSAVGAHVGTGAAGLPSSAMCTGNDTMDVHRRDAERKAIENALARAGDNRTVAARLLGVSRRTLYNKLSEFGLA
jgi:DNA-binding NtrC family response regulator